MSESSPYGTLLPRRNCRTIRNKVKPKHVLALILALMFSQASLQATESPEPPVPLRAVWSTSAIPAGGTSELLVVFDVPKGYHITDVANGLFFVRLSDTLGLSFGKPLFPAGVRLKDETVYRGRTVVRVPATAADTAVPGNYVLPVGIGYQLCQEFGTETCFLPQERTITATVALVPQGTAVTAANTELLATPPEEASLSLEERLLAALSRGSWIAFLLVFLGGILTSFTPCVYPVIPVTIGYIGGASKGKPLRGLALSAIFVLGIALVYSSLGLISAATGSLFGAFSGSPVVTIVVAAIFAVMGLSMLGAFEIALPASWQTRLQEKGKGRGWIGPLVIGMVSGLVMAPCVGPVIVALLAWVSKTGNLLYGWALLFVFSLGLGVLFLVIGTFAGAIQALPRAGAWMDSIKQGFGWILLAAALFLLRFVIPEPYFTLAWAVLLIVFAVFVGAFDTLSAEAGAGQRLWKATTLIVFLIGAILLFKGLGVAPTGVVERAELSWLVNKEEEAFAASQSENKPLIADFYADWCAACIELDHKTYAAPHVAERLAGFVRLKFDFTKQTRWVEEMKAKYRITGMPTVIFFDPGGNERARFTGFMPPREFLAFLDKHAL